MRRSIRPEWLLRQANELGGRDAQRGQPRNADLRRAVSAAYYALFHAVVNAATARLLPNCSDEDRWRLARHFQHQAIRQVCEWVAGPSNPPAKVAGMVKRLRATSAVQDLALSFVALQEARHRADYDHMADFTKAETLSLIDTAGDAVAKLEVIKETSDEERLVTLLALKSSIR